QPADTLSLPHRRVVDNRRPGLDGPLTVFVFGLNRLFHACSVRAEFIEASSRRQRRLSSSKPELASRPSSIPASSAAPSFGPTSPPPRRQQCFPAQESRRKGPASPASRAGPVRRRRR